MILGVFFLKGPRVVNFLCEDVVLIFFSVGIFCLARIFFKAHVLMISAQLYATHITITEIILKNIDKTHILFRLVKIGLNTHYYALFTHIILYYVYFK